MPRQAGIRRDITAEVPPILRKKYDDGLRASAEEEQLTGLVEHLPGLAFRCRNDDGWTVEFASQGALEVLGRSSQEIVGKPYLPLLHPDDREVISNDVRTAVAKRKPVQLVYRILTPHQEVRWVLEQRRPLQQKGEVTLLEGFAQDITTQKKLEEDQARRHAAVKDAATEWQLTLDAIHSPVLMVELDGKVRRLNHSANQLAGGSYEDNIGQPLSGLGPSQPWKKMWEMVRSIAAGGSPPSCEIKDQLSDKTWEVDAHLVTHGPARVILVARDISATVALQESLRRSETMSAMGQLVAGVAHEVRNPLFAITSTLDAFEARFGDAGQHARYFTVLRGELDRLTRLMTDLLEYGRPHRERRVRTNAASVVAQAVRACDATARQYGVTVSNRIDPVTEILVPLQPSRMAQVYQNLILNAIQHSEAGSVVTIDASTVERGEREFFRCAVSDEGTGLPPGDPSRVFDPFFTRRKGGTGLGLSIAQRIVEEHQGIIEAREGDGKGAVFSVDLPLDASSES